MLNFLGGVLRHCYANLNNDYIGILNICTLALIYMYLEQIQLNILPFHILPYQLMTINLFSMRIKKTMLEGAT